MPNQGVFRRGAPRGNRHPGSEFSSYRDPAHYIQNIYDFTLEGTKEGMKNLTSDPLFDKEIMDRAANLTPSDIYQTRIIEYAKKVILALEKEKRENTLPEVGVACVKYVGSFVTDTATHSSDTSDVVVQLNALPSSETIVELGRKIVENMRSADPKETGEPLPTEYGCLILSHSGRVRILVTIKPEDSTKLEPGLHLDVRQMMINYFAMRHIAWFSELDSKMSLEFKQEYRALVRVLKDVRSRYHNLKPMSIWTLQYFAFYCLINGPNRQKTSLGTAFRRFFELIAAGFFLPKAPCLVDPNAENHRIGFDLKLSQLDAICIGAQVIVRILATGSEGCRTILGTQGTPADITQTTSTWGKIQITPGKGAFKEGCMDTSAANIAPIV